MSIQDLLLDLAVRYGFQVLGALVILAVGFAVARWLGRVLDARLERQRMEPPLRLLLVRVVRIVVMLLALVVALDKFGFQIAPLVAGIGVAGLGVGIAMQGVLTDVLAGLTIIFKKPFRVGEHIAVIGVEGDVAAIDITSTTLVHGDGSRVIVPNRKIVGEILHNFGTTRQLSLSVMVPFDADLARVLALAGETVNANPRVLKEPAAVVGVAQIGDGGIKIAVYAWVRVIDFGAAGGELYRSLVDRLRAAGIAQPLPRQEVLLVGGASRGAA